MDREIYITIKKVLSLWKSNVVLFKELDSKKKDNLKDLIGYSIDTSHAYVVMIDNKNYFILRDVTFTDKFFEDYNGADILFVPKDLYTGLHLIDLDKGSIIMCSGSVENADRKNQEKKNKIKNIEQTKPEADLFSRDGLKLIKDCETNTINKENEIKDVRIPMYTGRELDAKNAKGSFSQELTFVLAGVDGSTDVRMKIITLKSSYVLRTKALLIRNTSGNYELKAEVSGNYVKPILVTILRTQSPKLYKELIDNYFYYTGDIQGSEKIIVKDPTVNIN